MNPRPSCLTRCLLALSPVLVSIAFGGQAAAAPMSTGSGVSFHARGSVEEIDVTGATSGTQLELVHAGKVLAREQAGSLGALAFRSLAPGSGYRVTIPGGPSSAPVTVLPDRSAPPSTKLYDQRLPTSGCGYLTVRDGTKLAINVRLPGGRGPYPTLIEYGGYAFADPYPGARGGVNNGIAPLATLLGFAVVDINMRGTGCSGGSFDFVDANQSLDGYDAVETVARQPWVLHHRIGLMGISYGGDSQLFVAATDPPHLAAITPLSVLDSYHGAWYPGGLFETGHALTWAIGRDHDALPASPTGGQPWALERI